MYQKYIDDMGNVAEYAIIRIADKTCIPFVADNSDYAEYLKWIEAGNSPLPAEEQA